jgi:hypothetical protein
MQVGDHRRSCRDARGALLRGDARVDKKAKTPKKPKTTKPKA